MSCVVLGVPQGRTPGKARGAPRRLALRRCGARPPKTLRRFAGMPPGRGLGLGRRSTERGPARAPQQGRPCRPAAGRQPARAWPKDQTAGRASCRASPIELRVWSCQSARAFDGPTIFDQSSGSPFRPGGLALVEAPAPELLRERAEHGHYRAFREVTDAYFAAFHGGDPEAIAAMIDFYGGPGTYASWPPRVRAYAAQTTPVNILDWASAYGFPLSAASLAAIDIPVLVVRGGSSPPAVQRAIALLGESIADAELATLEGAAHFMTATHAGQVAALIEGHVHGAGKRWSASDLD